MNDISKPGVLVVDDTSTNIDVVLNILQSEYEMMVALDGKTALEIVESKKPDLILLDIMMPEMDGYEVCEKLKANPATKKIPVIFLTAKTEVTDETRGFEVGAIDYITKPISPPILEKRVKTHLALYDQNRVLEEKVKQRTHMLRNTQLEIARRLGRAGEYKDNETGWHVMRMSHYSKLIALAAGWDKDEVELLLNASPMHDIGKIGIPDRVLLKPGKLDDEEWKLMRQHCSFGAEIIGEHDSELLKMARSVALTHHEKWNGKGYPNGIAGEEIPVEGRIVAIADVFDALTSERPYKKAWPEEKAINLIKEESGQHFDPKLVEAFTENIPEILKIKEKYSEREDKNLS